MIASELIKALQDAMSRDGDFEIEIVTTAGLKEIDFFVRVEKFSLTEEFPGTYTWFIQPAEELTPVRFPVSRANKVSAPSST